MHDVLVIYKQLELRLDGDGKFIPFPEGETPVPTLSYDEKPGVQAIAATSDDKAPAPYKWKYKMDTINLADEDVSQIIYEVVNAEAAKPGAKDKRAPIPAKRRKKTQRQCECTES